MSSPSDVMNRALQLTTLKRIFQKLNPDTPMDLIDWEQQIDESLTLPENRVQFSIAYPQYKWFEDEQARRDTKREAVEELRNYLNFTLGFVDPEIADEIRKLFEDRMSAYRYRMERNISIAGLKKKIINLKEQLEEAKKKGAPPPEPKEIEEAVREPRPPRFTRELETKLRDIFKISFLDRGMNPNKYMPYFRTELDVIKLLPSEDEMVKAVETLAQEIIRREQAKAPRPPIKPPEEEERRREVAIGLPPEEEEPGIMIPMIPTEFPEYPEKSFVPSRRLTGSERDQLWDNFVNDLFACGKAYPHKYKNRFDDWLGTYLFSSWDQVKKNYESLIDIVCYGKEIELIPRALPAEAIEDLIHWLVSLSNYPKPGYKYNSIQEIIDKLYEVGRDATREDVIAAIKRGWKDKVPNFIVVEKEHLEDIIGEKLD